MFWIIFCINVVFNKYFSSLVKLIVRFVWLEEYIYILIVILVSKLVVWFYGWYLKL